MDALGLQSALGRPWACCSSFCLSSLICQSLRVRESDGCTSHSKACFLILPELGSFLLYLWTQLSTEGLWLFSFYEDDSPPQSPHKLPTITTVYFLNSHIQTNRQTNSLPTTNHLSFLFSNPQKALMSSCADLPPLDILYTGTMRRVPFWNLSCSTGRLLQPSLTIVTVSVLRSFILMSNYWPGRGTAHQLVGILIASTSWLLQIMLKTLVN